METCQQTLPMTLTKAHTSVLTRETNITLPFSKNELLMPKKTKNKMMKIIVLKKAMFLRVEFKTKHHIIKTHLWMQRTFLGKTKGPLAYLKNEEVTQSINLQQVRRPKAHSLYNLRSIKTKILLRKWSEVIKWMNLKMMACSAIVARQITPHHGVGHNYCLDKLFKTWQSKESGQVTPVFTQCLEC
jgi:hypothetical protein